MLKLAREGGGNAHEERAMPKSLRSQMQVSDLESLAHMTDTHAARLVENEEVLFCKLEKCHSSLVHWCMQACVPRSRSVCVCVCVVCGVCVHVHRVSHSVLEH